MYENRFITGPDSIRFPGYPMAIGHIFNEAAHAVNGNRYPSNLYNVHFVVKGRGWLRTPTETIQLRQGMGFLYAANQTQHYGADSSEPWEVWWLYFSGEGMRDLLGDKCLGEVWAFEWGDNERLLPLVQELWKVGGLRKLSLTAKIASLFYEIMLELLLHAKNVNTPNKGNLENSILRTSNYIRLNSSRKLTLAGLADYCGISPAYFSRMFHAYMGMPPLEYLNIQRIELSRQMLLATSNSIKQIAIEAGFSSPSYYIERFHKLEGMTPAAFREKYRFE